MAKYEHKGSMHVFKKKNGIGDWVAGIICVFVLLAIIGAFTG